MTDTIIHSVSFKQVVELIVLEHCGSPSGMRVEGAYSSRHFTDTGDFMQLTIGKEAEIPSDDNIIPAKALRPITSVTQMMYAGFGCVQWARQGQSQ